MRLLALTLVLVFMRLLTELFAQNNTDNIFRSSLSQYISHYYGVNEGFVAGRINDITQDENGYLWIASHSGLYRYDGINFKEYTKKDFKYLESNHFVGMAKDKQGKLWIATQNNGLIGYTNFHFLNTDSISSAAFKHTIRCIYATAKKQIVIGTEKEGVFIFENNKYKRLDIIPELKKASITAINQDKLGNLWIGTTQLGVLKLIPTANSYKLEKVYLYGESFSVNTLLTDIFGVIWIGTTKGLYKYDGKEFSQEKIIKEININSIAQDSAGNLLIAAENGIYKKKANTDLVDSYTYQQGFPFESTKCIFSDRENTIWISSDKDKGELVQLISGKLISFTTKENLASNQIQSFAQLSGTMRYLIATDSDKLNKLTLNGIEPEYGFKTDSLIKHITSDSQYVYISANVLYLFEHKGKLKKKFEEIHNPYLSYTKNSNQIWVANSTNLYLIQDDIVTPIASYDSTVVYDIVQDSKDNIYLATKIGLIITGKNKPYKLLTKADGLAGNSVYSLLIDEKNITDKNTIWAATSEGISTISNNKIQSYNASMGWTTNVVYALKEEGEKIWFTHENGIGFIAKSYFEGNTNEKPTTFDVRDGLRSTYYDKPIGIYQDKKNRLWFTASDGLYTIDPQDISINTQKPIISIYQLIADKRVITNLERISVAPGVNRFELDFAVVSLINPQKVKIKYMMEGFDEDWKEVDTERRAVYTNLSSGNYVFKVIACNSDGVWDNTGKSVSFHYQPYFFKTTLFYTAIIFLIIFLIIVLYRMKMKMVKKRTEELLRLVVKRTNEINTQKNQIEKQKNEIQSKRDELQKAYKIIEEKNQSITDSIRYAQTIQQAVLPTDEELYASWSDFFVIFQPRDIVSGDFYWYALEDRYKFIAVVDCTGHGVPGAFMSLVANDLLKEIISKGTLSPYRILELLHENVRTALKQEEAKNADGMDVALCRIEDIGGKRRRVLFAGAKRPLFYVTDGKLKEIRGDRKSIGGQQKEDRREFTNHEILLNEGDKIYLFTDGIIDQNDAENKKFGSIKLWEILQNTAHLNCESQKELLLKEFQNHRMGTEQRDDITILGIRV